MKISIWLIISMQKIVRWSKKWKHSINFATNLFYFRTSFPLWKHPVQFFVKPQKTDNEYRHTTREFPSHSPHTFYIYTYIIYIVFNRKTLTAKIKKIWNGKWEHYKTLTDMYFNAYVLCIKTVVIATIFMWYLIGF